MIYFAFLYKLLISILWRNKNMSEFKPRKNMLYKEIHVDNFREMIDYTANTYKDRIAFSYKKDKLLFMFQKSMSLK